MNEDDRQRQLSREQAVAIEAEERCRKGMLNHEGIGTPIDYQEAFQCFRWAAARGHSDAQAMLSLYYGQGLISAPDPREAYIWAILARSADPRLVDSETLELLSGQLPQKVLLAAQKEAKRRHSECLKTGEMTLPEDAPASPSAEPPAQSGLGWKVADIRALRVTLYAQSGKIRLQHGSQSHLATAAELFSDNCLRLLIAYDKLRTYGEGSLGYYESTLADARKRSQRTNRQIVADFNHALRKHLGLDKQCKPFVWLGNRHRRDLKANFSLTVVY